LFDKNENASAGASRKLSAQESASFSGALDNIDSSRSAGNKLVRPVTLLNVPKPAFTPLQHLTLDLLTEVPLAGTREEIGREVGVDMCPGHNQESLAGQARREQLLEDRAAEAPMPPAALDSAFQLLARWVVRRARERADSAVQAEAPDRFRKYSVCTRQEDSTPC